MSGIGDKFKQFLKPGPKPSTMMADEPEAVDNAKEEAAEPAYERGKNLGRFLHPKKQADESESVDNPAEDSAEPQGVGSRWKRLQDASKKMIPMGPGQMPIRDLSKSSPMGTRG